MIGVGPFSSSTSRSRSAPGWCSSACQADDRGAHRRWVRRHRCGPVAELSGGVAPQPGKSRVVFARAWRTQETTTPQTHTVRYPRGDLPFLQQAPFGPGPPGPQLDNARLVAKSVCRAASRSPKLNLGEFGAAHLVWGFRRAQPPTTSQRFPSRRCAADWPLQSSPAPRRRRQQAQAGASARDNPVGATCTRRSAR